MNAREGAAPGQAAYEALASRWHAEIRQSEAHELSAEHQMIRDAVIGQKLTCLRELQQAVTAAAAAQPAHDFSCHADDRIHAEDCECWCHDAAEAAAAQPASGDELRATLESLARFWVREYVTADGWPDVCAKQLLDVLGGVRERPAPALNLPGEALAADNHKLRRQNAALRDGITALAEDFEHSAAATAPSKKSAIETTVAQRLRVLLEQP